MIHDKEILPNGCTRWRDTAATGALQYQYTSIEYVTTYKTQRNKSLKTTAKEKRKWTSKHPYTQTTLAKKIILRYRS